MTFAGGKLDPHPEETHPRLKLANYMSVTPAVPAVVDWASKVTEWPMYKNDTIGDCTCASAGHQVQAWTTYGEGATVTLTDQDVLALYEAVSGYDPATGANDNGAVGQDVLDYIKQNGIGGHKIVAFAQVDHTDLAEMKQALYIFGSLYCGIQCPYSALQQAGAGLPWTVVPSSIDGGHAIPIQKWDADYLYCVTWGKLQPMTPDFWTTYGDEAWVVITEDWINQQTGLSPDGLDLNALLSDFAQLTGVVVAPPAPPAPPQPPAPTPTPKPFSILAWIEAWLRRLFS